MIWITYNYTGATTTTTIPNTLDFNGIDWAVPVIAKQAKVKQGNEEGYACLECKDFYPMAELNIPEGSTDCHSFQCYSCRKGLKTLFKKEEK